MQIGRHVVVGLGLMLGVGCPPAGDGPEPVGFDRTAMLENLADNVIIATYDDFERAMATLSSDTATYADAATVGPAPAAKAAAQASFRAALSVWERGEVMQVGPAAPSYRPGGRDLRDEIYSWYDQVNPCAVDQQIVADEFEDEGFFSRKLTPVKGLDALEYVLFYDGADNACAAPATINTSGSWAALSADQLRIRRARYAAALSQYVESNAHTLCSAWHPENEDFRTAFVNGEGDVYQSQAESIDAAFAAMYYVELMTKDHKLAEPLGLHVDCAADRCPEAAESQYAGLSRVALRENLVGFRLMLTGDEGYGFDDALAEVDAGDLATRMIGNVDAALALVDSDDRDVATLVQSDPDAAMALYDAVKLVTDDLKSQMVTALNLTVPDEGAGDND